VHWGSGKQGFIFCLAGLRKADEHGVGQTNIRSLLSRYSVGNNVVVPMARENGWHHHRKGARSESHEIKGEVFKARVLSVWKATRPHQKMRPTPRDIKQSSGQKSKRRGDVTEVRVQTEGENPEQL
jgi:hypothetical protein